MILWHNPRCTKSRQTLALLQENGVEPTIRLYLQDPPDTSEIRAILAKLDIAPIQMMRVKEKAFKEAGLSRDSDDDTLIAAMVETPILIERPLVETEKGVALCRPQEKVFDLL